MVSARNTRTTRLGSLIQSALDRPVPTTSHRSQGQLGLRHHALYHVPTTMANLDHLSLKQLRKRASKLRVARDYIDAARDSDDPRDHLIALCCAAAGPLVERVRVPSPVDVKLCIVQAVVMEALALYPHELARQQEYVANAMFTQYLQYLNDDNDEGDTPGRVSSPQRKRRRTLAPAAA